MQINGRSKEGGHSNRDYHYSKITVAENSSAAAEDNEQTNFGGVAYLAEQEVEVDSSILGEAEDVEQRKTCCVDSGTTGHFVDSK